MRGVPGMTKAKGSAVFRRIWSYIKTAFGMKAEGMMDPAVQIEQAVNEARKQDQQLREQAARVIAHRSEIQMKLDRAADTSVKAKQTATQALMQVQKAQQAGDAEALDKWTRTAQALAMELETTESLLEGLKTQYTTANEQAELAKQHVNANAMRLKELTAKRMELVGKLQQAKMQEQVNKTLEAINRPVESNAPSLESIEDKINKRMALASAKSEIEKNSLEGAQRELKDTMMEAGGMARLESLKAELGMATEPAAAEPVAAAAGVTTQGNGAEAPLMLDDGADEADAAKLAELAESVQEVPVEVEQREQ